jgi:hypothetical protein
MIETQEQIRDILAIAGEALTFTGFSIQSFPGVEVQFLLGEHSSYLTSTQTFIFQVAASDVMANNINKGTKFTYTDGVYFFAFTVSKPPMPDLTGWLGLMCTLDSMQVVASGTLIYNSAP